LLTNVEKDGTTGGSRKGQKGRKERPEFSPLGILEAYKRQPNNEKLHSVLKSVLKVMPVWLKRV
ncbi:MAG: hypothetical protein GWN97_00950, partial [Thermoplasmata archaeon]|nr:hypothetical protein [Thermoplasmata archaeon]